MAVTKHKVDSGELTVWTGNAASAFDPATLKMVAIAQSYSMEENCSTQEVKKLGAADAKWANPEAKAFDWKVDVDSLNLITDSNGTVEVDDSSEQIAKGNLKVGDTVWVALKRSADTTGFRYGKALVQSYKENGQAGEFNTYSLSLLGKGELLNYVAQGGGD